MSTLYFCVVERRNFGDLISVEGASRLDLRPVPDLDSLLRQPPPGQAVLAIWSQDPQAGIQLPELLICQDGTESDWAAWITTFGSKIRPFSAYMRLLTHSEFQNVAKGIRTPTLDRLTWPVAGLVLGEVLAASRLPDSSLETVPAAACASTLSFAMFRAAATYCNFQQWSQLVKAWQFVREVTRQRPRSVEGAAVAHVCATIMEAAGVRNSNAFFGALNANVVRACHEVITSPERGPSSLSIIPEFAATEEKMHGSREDRVVAFAEFVQRIGAISGLDPELTSFMLGYLASRIAPGTIQHSSVLGPIAHRYATASLWYGFCAGFGGTDLNVRSASGRRPNLDLPASARRVARDLLRPEPVVASPSCDIAFLELVALSRSGGDPLGGLMRTTQGTVTIELAPAVWTVVNVSSRSGAEGLTRTSRDRETLAAMGEHIERLREAYSDLLWGEDASREGGQRSLFVPRPKKSKRP